MSELFDRLVNLPPKRLALLVMDLQERLAATQSDPAAAAPGVGPIAVVGMACRFPGAPDVDAFWRLQIDGVDAIREIPASRWDVDAYYDPDPDAPGGIATRWAGTIDGIDEFEPALFGISPREAASMDPQQRLLLEVAWEALEDAGIAPDSLAGTATGAFVGVCNTDYAQLLMEGDGADFDMYQATGNATSVASGRLSYVLGLQGPALTVDTACSSSLVAVHLAVQALRTGQCRAALAGGVNVLLSPKTTMMLSRARMMAPDGRCKTFDSRADGFVRGEGCGLVVLKRWSDARADGDRVLAVIRGSAVNQDGRSNGLTAPNGPSQTAVIRAALADAGIEPAAVGYVEAHGTGTALGDPVELQALGAALGPGRPPASPVRVGSVKTNIGHLESAAGVAGLIKVVLALRHGELPPLLHLRERNPLIPWDDLPIEPTADRTPWPAGVRRVAGVSSFGFSGTNAHLIVESAADPAPASEPAEDASPGDDIQVRTAVPLRIAARTPSALRAVARRVADHLAAHPQLDLGAVAAGLATGRAELARRAVVLADDVPAAAAALRAWAAGGEPPSGATVVDREPERLGARRPEVAFLFTGHGSQYAGMGAGLHAAEPVVRASIERCAAVLDPLLGVPLQTVLFDPVRSGDLLADMALAQPALFALQVALVDLWASWGVRPSVVTGHSVGEYVAAVVAGVMSLEDGLRLVAARGRLMAGLPRDGAMAAFLAPEAAVLDLLASVGAAATIAAVNGPASVAVSAPAPVLAEVVAAARTSGIEVRPLDVPVAAHSAQVDPILDELEAVASTVALSPPRIDVVSGMTGAPIQGDDLISARYWRRHLREPVRFADAFAAVVERGIRTFVEIGPHPTLLNMGRHIVDERACAWLPSLRSGHDDVRQARASAAGLWVAGVPIAWSQLLPAGPRAASLPTYPFERERHWVEPTSGGERRRGAHPLLGERLDSPALDAVVFESRLGVRHPAFLDHHRVYGTAILPSPAYLEMALVAADRIGPPGSWSVEGFEIRTAMVLPDEGDRVVQLVLRECGPSEPDTAARTFEVISRGAEGGTWTTHATGRLRRTGVAADPDRVDLTGARERCAERVDGAAYYAALAERGLDFGERFRGVREVWRRDGEAVGRVALPPDAEREARAYRIHPALLDACFHVLGAAMFDVEHGDAHLLVGLDEFRLLRPPGTTLWNHTVVRPGAPGAGILTGDIRLVDEVGAVVAEVRGLHLRHASAEALARATHRAGREWQYELAWEDLGAPGTSSGQAPAGAGSDAARADPRLDTDALAEQLSAGLGAAVPRLAAEEAFLRGLDEVALAGLPGALGAPPVAPHTAGETGAGEAGAGEAGADGAGVSNPSDAHARRRARLEHHLRSNPAPAGEVGTLAAELRRRYPDREAEVDLVARCAVRLGEVLAGRVEPLELLFPGGDQEPVAAIYGATPSARAVNAAVGDLVARLARSAAGPLRVVEVGAGTGATTRAVLAAAPAGSLDYTVTDVSPTLLSRTEREVAGHPALAASRFERLDVEVGPAGGPLDGVRADVVIAANVVHATADVARALGTALDLLVPGGILVLVEATAAGPAVDVTFGLTDGWWRGTDLDRRPDHPLLDAPGWLAAVQDAGFLDARVVQPAALRAAGASAVVVARAPERDAGHGVSWVVVDHRGASPLAVALGELLTQRGEPWQRASGTESLRAALRPTAIGSSVRVVDVGAASAAVPRTATAAELALSAVATVRAAVDAPAAARTWLVTSGAVRAGGEVPWPPASATWGIGRVAALEHPDAWGGSIDVDPAAPVADQAATVVAAVERSGDDDQVVVRDGAWSVPRLRRRRPAAAAAAPIRPGGGYLVTGGLGGLGLELLAWLAAGGAGAVVLTGRRGLPPADTWPAAGDGSILSRQLDAIRAATAAGTRVEVVAADVADRESMAALVTRFGRDLPPLAGVVHAAAAMSSAPIAELTDEQVRETVRAKVEGAVVLDELTRDLDLATFVLFSSTTAVWGSRGLAHYAAANLVLDSLATARRAAGVPAVSIGWGTWERMRVATERERAEVAASGLAPMAVASALEVLGDLLADAALPPHVIVADVDWPRLRAVYESRRPRPLFGALGHERPLHRPPVGGADTSGEGGAPLAAALSATAGPARFDLAAAFVRAEVARALGIDDPATVDLDQGMFEMGMDSLMSVELKGRVERAIGLDLPSTVTFNYPTVRALARHLVDDVLRGGAAAGEASTGAAPAAPAAPDLPAPAAEDLSEDELASMLAARLARIDEQRRS